MIRPLGITSRRSRSSALSIIAGGAIALPLLVSGHGSEFLEAKLFFDAAGNARLEITADYSGNPMIATREEAQAALDDILRIELDGQEHRLGDLAPVKLEPRDQPDPASPLPRAPEFQNLKHELLTALWRWQPDRSRFQFNVPPGRQHTVVFWMQEKDGAIPRWVMLVAGDQTPFIDVPARPASWVWALAALVAILSLVGAWGQLQKAGRRSGTGTKDEHGAALVSTDGEIFTK